MREVKLMRGRLRKFVPQRVHAGHCGLVGDGHGQLGRVARRRA